jgi:hypothetical protein
VREAVTDHDEGGDPACWAAEFQEHLGLDDPDSAGADAAETARSVEDADGDVDGSG